jgi:ribosome maturation factor RimP
MRTRKSTAADATASRPADRPDRSDRPDRAARRRPNRSASSSTASTPATRATPATPAMLARWTLAPEIEAEIAEIATACGCELIHAEWKGGVLRLVLDRPPAATAGDVAAAAGDPTAGAKGAPRSPASPLPKIPQAPEAPEVAGVSLADCEHVAKQTSALLDVLDFSNGRYLLEVSSPGLDRQLYRPSDYRRFLGRLARVTYSEAASPADPGVPHRRTVVARLSAFHPPAGAQDAGAVTLIDDRTGERLTLKLEDVRLARLEVEL